MVRHLTALPGGDPTPPRKRRVLLCPTHIRVLPEDSDDGRHVVLALDERARLITWAMHPTDAVEIGTALLEAGIAAGGES